MRSGALVSHESGDKAVIIQITLSYYFEGRFDLVKFVKTVQEADLFVHLRIGPYACAEWNYGGFPMWLHLIPGIQFRTTNELFKMTFSGATELLELQIIAVAERDEKFSFKNCGPNERKISLHHKWNRLFLHSKWRGPMP